MDIYENVDPTVSPHTRGGKNKVCPPRKAVLLPLALGFILLLTLTALIAVVNLYINEQAKFRQLEKMHKNLSTTLNASGCRFCPNGWDHHSGKCYHFSSDKKNWTEGRDQCITLGGHLAIVNNWEEQKFLSLNGTEKFYWIGLNDQETEGQWMWVDNTPHNKTGEVFWKQGHMGNNEPDNWKGENMDGENCGLVSNVGDWHDNSCKNKWNFICETIATDWTG